MTANLKASSKSRPEYGRVDDKDRVKGDALARDSWSWAKGCFDSASRQDPKQTDESEGQKGIKKVFKEDCNHSCDLYLN